MQASEKLKSWSITLSEPVKKRVAFYIEGYDPRGARHYYNLYRLEAAKEARKGGVEIGLSERTRTAEKVQSCRITCRSDAAGETAETVTEYHFLEWDDLIRKNWKSSVLSVFADLWFYLRVYMFTGLIVKFGRLSPYQMIAAFYPVFYLLGTLLLGGAAAWFACRLGAEYGYALAGAAAGALLFAGIVKGAILAGNSIAVFWLLRIYVFSARYALEEMEELAQRIDRFADTIARTLERIEEDGVDEVLIVSHSVGTMIAIPVLAQALQRAKVPEELLGRVSVMSLGECIALVSFLEKATEYKQAMASLAAAPGICWLDYTSVIDGGCFPQLDYYRHSGVKKTREETPLYLSTRFHTLYTPATYAALSKNKYLAHFLYLMATECDGGYNFIKMTAGHRRLCDYA